MSRRDFWRCSLNTFQAMVEAHNDFNDPERAQGGGRGSAADLARLPDEG